MAPSVAKSGAAVMRHFAAGDMRPILAVKFYIFTIDTIRNLTVVMTPNRMVVDLSSVGCLLVNSGGLLTFANCSFKRAKT